MNQNTVASIVTTDSTNLLISFCNQLSSPECSLLVMTANGNADASWVDYTAIPIESRRDFTGISGICRIGVHVVIATQSSTPILALINLSSAEVVSYVDIKKGKDLHSLVYHEDYIYVVSTGTNEIYRVSFYDGQFGEEELFWGYPCVNYDRDEVHLNGLTIDGDRLIASCFGPRNTEGSWQKEGRVFYVGSGHTIHESLNQPHSPIVDGRRLIIAESAARQIHIYNKDEQDEWGVGKEVDVDVYVRGVTITNGRLWVGVSADRKLSRSRHRFLDEGQQKRADSKIVEIDLLTGLQITDKSLLEFGREIYDVVSIHTSPPMLPVHTVISSRIRKMETSVDLYMADLKYYYSENQENINRLRLAQDDLRLAQEDLDCLLQSKSWRITKPLRSINKLWSRSKLLKG